jgi:arsenate reductase (thioredoxin)
MRERPYHALFLCTQNSARSILAESIMNKLGKDKCKGFSAGSQPSGKVHPYALDLLTNLGHDVTGLRSKSWAEFAHPGAPTLDFVFTVCDNAAREVCPVWPGQPVTAQWSMADPSLAEGSETERRLAFANTVRMLSQRISIFLALPSKALDRLALENRLAAIGRSNTD